MKQRYYTNLLVTFYADVADRFIERTLNERKLRFFRVPTIMKRYHVDVPVKDREEILLFLANLSEVKSVRDYDDGRQR